MKHVGECLSGENVDVKIAACKCLHSLSRSTKLLRTTIIDTEAWRPVLEVHYTHSLDFSLLSSSLPLSPHSLHLICHFLPSDILLPSFFSTLCLSVLLTHSLPFLSFSLPLSLSLGVRFGGQGHSPLIDSCPLGVDAHTHTHTY